MGSNPAAFRFVNSLISMGYEILIIKSQCDFIHFTLQPADWLTDLGLNHAMALEPHLLHDPTHINLRKQMQVGVQCVQIGNQLKLHFIWWLKNQQNALVKRSEIQIISSQHFTPAS